MSQEITAWDTDANWLHEKLAVMKRRPTVDQEESFCERVAIKVADGTPPNIARIEALKEIF